MIEKRYNMIKSLVCRGLVSMSMSALILFQVNVGQVSAEEFVEDFQEQSQLEEISELSTESLESMEEVTSNTEKELESSSEEKNLEESVEEDTSDLLEEVKLEDREEQVELVPEESEVTESEVPETIEEEAEVEIILEEEIDDSILAGEIVEEIEVEIEEELEVEIEEELEDNPQIMTDVSRTAASKKKVEVNRIAGQNRYKNAAALSASGWNTAKTVILTNGESFADSLTGSPLASLHNAPILLTRADRLPSETLAEIKRLKATQVIALGGELSISNSVLNTLQANGFSTRRIGGRNRYILAENIAKEVMTSEGMNRDAFLVSGEVYSDAMSIAPIAASKRLPIFLTRSNILHQTVINAIPHVNQWTIIGGNLTINSAVQKEMSNKGAKTRRIEGRSRYDVNQNIINHYGTSNDHMYVASGEHFTDATPASVLAARKKSSVLLVRNNKSTLKDQRDFANKKGIKRLTLIGGPLTISKASEDYFNNQNYLIYLDPGHGSSDTGAYYGGVAERDINLPLSKKIQSQLIDLGYRVAMSRTTSQNQYHSNSRTDLFARPEAANRLNADLLVSVHFDAMPGNTLVDGISVFTYSPSSQYPPLNKNKNSHTNPHRLAESRKLASGLQNELINITGATNRGTRTGAFVVLREAKMPAVLLELGFMTNPSELQRIQTNWYQERLTTGVVNGINRYFKI